MPSPSKPSSTARTVQGAEAMAWRPSTATTARWPPRTRQCRPNPINTSPRNPSRLSTDPLSFPIESPLPLLQRELKISRGDRARRHYLAPSTWPLTSSSTRKTSKSLPVAVFFDYANESSGASPVRSSSPPSSSYTSSSSAIHSRHSGPPPTSPLSSQ